MAVRMNQAVFVERLCRKDVNPPWYWSFFNDGSAAQKICHHFLLFIVITEEDLQLEEADNV